MKALLALWLCLLALPAWAQSVSVTGLDGRSRTFTVKDLAALPNEQARLTSRDGATTIYEGPGLGALLQAVGAPSGKALHGADMSDVVLVVAKDGYRAAFALAETDSSIRGDKILLADKADGHPLNATEGPLRLVVEGDLRPARSVRMVTAIRLIRLPGARRAR